MKLSGANGTLRLGPQSWALAMYDQELRPRIRANILGLRGHWTVYVRRCVEAGLMPPDTDVDAVAKALLGLVPGFLIQRLVIEDVEPEDVQKGLRVLMGMRVPAGDSAPPCDG